MRGRRSISKRINNLQAYQKPAIEGLIIYIDATDGWCNIELPDGTILYRITFAEGANPRLKRLQQNVTITQTYGSRYKYVISGSGTKIVDSLVFADKGVTTWDASPTKAQWTKKYQWK